jgi:O-antigen ligase
MFGVNPSNSLWSNFERMEGFVTHIHLFVLTLILLSLRLTEIEWRRALQIQLAAGVCVLLYSIGEYTTINAKLAAGEAVGRRLAATLGNPAYLAIYSAFNVFIALILAAKIKVKKTISIAKVVYIGIALLHLFVLWQTQTRGTILGLVAGLGVVLLWILWKNRSNQKVRNISLIGIALFATVFFLFISIKETAFVQNNPTLKRLADIELGEQTVRSRIMIWQMSFEGVKERPILGWGQDNFGYVFAKHYNPEMFDQEQWFDRSHNVFFDWLIAAGVLGLLAYLSLYGVSIYSIITNRHSRFSNTEQALLLGLLVTYFIHNIIVFDNLISYISFFALFAYIHTDTRITKIAYSKRKVTSTVYVVFAITAISMSIVLYHIVYKPHALNRAIIQMFDTQQDKTIEQVIDISTQMTKPVLYGNTEANEHLLTLVNMVLNSNATDIQKNNIYTFAQNIFDAEIARDSANPRQATIMASFLASLGGYRAAVPYYEEALKRTPRKTLLWADLAQVYLASDIDQNTKIAKAQQAARTSHTLSPRSIRAAVILAHILYEQKLYGEVETVWKETIAQNKNSQESILTEIAFYKEKKDQLRLRAAQERFLEIYPQFEKELLEKTQ